MDMDMIMDTNTTFVMVLSDEIREFETFEEAASFFEELSETDSVAAYMTNGVASKLILAR